MNPTKKDLLDALVFMLSLCAGCITIVTGAKAFGGRSKAITDLERRVRDLEERCRKHDDEVKSIRSEYTSLVDKLIDQFKAKRTRNY